MQEKAECLWQNNYLNLRDFPRSFQVTAEATDYCFFLLQHSLLHNSCPDASSITHGTGLETKQNLFNQINKQMSFTTPRS
jgi:hypothetical protein